MLQMTLHLDISTPRMFQIRLKKATSTVSVEIGTQRRDFQPLEDKIISMF
jgi:hypothetical protein